MQRGDNGPRIEEIERRLILLDTSTRNIYRREIALWQQLWDAWSEVRLTAPTPTPTPTPNTGVSGTLFGCLGSGIPGTITVVDSTTMASYLSTTTASNGTWSGSFYLASNTSVIITATPTAAGARLTAGSSTRTLTAGGTNSGLNVTASPASGYVCSAACLYPVKTALTLASSGACGGTTYPSDTLNWQPSPPNIGVSGAGWYGSTTYHVAGQGLNNFKYWFSISPLGVPSLTSINQSGGIDIFICNLTLNQCGDATNTFSASAVCATQAIGCTIHE
jgi:hypothetical protein